MLDDDIDASVALLDRDPSAEGLPTPLIVAEQGPPAYLM